MTCQAAFVSFHSWIYFYVLFAFPFLPSLSFNPYPLNISEWKRGRSQTGGWVDSWVQLPILIQISLLLTWPPQNIWKSGAHHLTFIFTSNSRKGGAHRKHASRGPRGSNSTIIHTFLRSAPRRWLEMGNLAPFPSLM